MHVAVRITVLFSWYCVTYRTTLLGLCGRADDFRSAGATAWSLGIPRSWIANFLAKVEMFYENLNDDWRWCGGAQAVEGLINQGITIVVAAGMGPSLTLVQPDDGGCTSCTCTNVIEPNVL